MFLIDRQHVEAVLTVPWRIAERSQDRVVELVVARHPPVLRDVRRRDRVARIGHVAYEGSHRAFQRRAVKIAPGDAVQIEEIVDHAGRDDQLHPLLQRAVK